MQINDNLYIQYDPEDYTGSYPCFIVKIKKSQMTTKLESDLISMVTDFFKKQEAV